MKQELCVFTERTEWEGSLEGRTKVEARPIVSPTSRLSPDTGMRRRFYLDVDEERFIGRGE